MRNPPYVIKSANGRIKEIQRLEQEHNIDGSIDYLLQPLKYLDFTRNQIKSLKLLKIETLFDFKKFKAQELHETSGMPDKAALAVLIEKARENGAWFFDDYPRPAYILGQIVKYAKAFSSNDRLLQITSDDIPLMVSSSVTEVSHEQNDIVLEQQEAVLDITIGSPVQITSDVEVLATNVVESVKNTVTVRVPTGAVRGIKEELEYQDNLLGITQHLPSYLAIDINAKSRKYFPGITDGMQKALEQSDIRNMNDLRQHTLKSLKRIKGLADIKVRKLISSLEPIGLILFDEMQNHDRVIEQVKKGMKWYRTIKNLSDHHSADKGAEEKTMVMSFTTGASEHSARELRILKKVGEMLGNKKDIFLMPVLVYHQQHKSKTSLMRFAGEAHTLIGDIAMMSKQDLVSFNASKDAVKEIDTELRQLGLRLGLREEAAELLQQEEEYQMRIEERQSYYRKAFE